MPQTAVRPGTRTASRPFRRRLALLTSAMVCGGLAAAPPALADGVLPGAPTTATNAVDSVTASAPPAPLPAAPAAPVPEVAAPSPAPQVAAPAPPSSAPSHPAVTQATTTATQLVPPASDAVSTVAEPLRDAPSSGGQPARPDTAASGGESRSDRSTPTFLVNLGRPAAFGPLSLVQFKPDALGDLIPGPEGVAEASQVARARSSEPSPGRRLPLPDGLGGLAHTGAGGAAAALLILLLALLAEGLALAPPGFRRMVSLRRLQPASYPFLLELERPD